MFLHKVSHLGLTWCFQCKVLLPTHFAHWKTEKRSQWLSRGQLVSEPGIWTQVHLILVPMHFQLWDTSGRVTSVCHLWGYPGHPLFLESWKLRHKVPGTDSLQARNRLRSGTHSSSAPACGLGGSKRQQVTEGWGSLLGHCGGALHTACAVYYCTLHLLS